MNIIAEKSYVFAIEIVNAYKHLRVEKKEFILSKQLLRSGTAIGALVRESAQAESKADFLHKLNIALKEANETTYWLELLKDTTYLDQSLYDKLNASCIEINRLLISIVKTTKKSLGRL